MTDRATYPGVVTVPSAYAATETLDRLAALLRQKGLTVFLRLDQQAEARRVGLTLRPTHLLLFGNPAAGTLMMQAVPQSALDLPLKAVAWEDDQHQTWVSYNDPTYLQQRYHLTDALLQTITGAGALIDVARTEAGKAKGEPTW